MQIWQSTLLVRKHPSTLLQPTCHLAGPTSFMPKISAGQGKQLVPGYVCIPHHGLVACECNYTSGEDEFKCMTEPLHVRALDEFRGRLTRLCLKTEFIDNAAQLLVQSVFASIFFKDGEPLQVDNILSVLFRDFIRDKVIAAKLVAASVLQNDDATTSNVWLAGDFTLDEAAFAAVLMNQAVALLKKRKMTVREPSISRSELEAAYTQKIVVRNMIGMQTQITSSGTSKISIAPQVT